MSDLVRAIESYKHYRNHQLANTPRYKLFIHIAKKEVLELLAQKHAEIDRTISNPETRELLKSSFTKQVEGIL